MEEWFVMKSGLCTGVQYRCGREVSDEERAVREEGKGQNWRRDPDVSGAEFAFLPRSSSAIGILPFQAWPALPP